MGVRHVSHFIERCIHGTLVSQCRCPGPKTVRTVPCPPSCSSVPKIHPPMTSLYSYDMPGGPYNERECAGVPEKAFRAADGKRDHELLPVACLTDGSPLSCIDDYIGGGSHYWTLICTVCQRIHYYDTYLFTLG